MLYFAFKSDLHTVYHVISMHPISAFRGLFRTCTCARQRVVSQKVE